MTLLLIGNFGTYFDLYLNYFKFSPEITYAFGLKNLLVQDNNILTKPIDRLTSKIIQISFAKTSGFGRKFATNFCLKR